MLLDESILRLIGRGHFCHALHVAMQSGLYHPPDFWRSGVQSLRILEFSIRAFPADCPSTRDFHCRLVRPETGLAASTLASTGDSSIWPDFTTTVVRSIVTAAVYRGFNQELAPHHLTFRHRAGVTPYTSTFVFAECCVFVKQSQPPFHCDPFRLPLYAFTYQGRTLSRSYGANLPSSFTRVLSSALEYSSCPPVSVCGTVDLALKLRGFSWKQGISSFRRASPPSSSRLS